MFTKIALSVGAVALTAGLAAAPAAAAPANDGAACVQAGIGTLKDLGLMKAAAQKEIDYSTLANRMTCVPQLRGFWWHVRECRCWSPG